MDRVFIVGEWNVGFRKLFLEDGYFKFFEG